MARNKIKKDIKTIDVNDIFCVADNERTDYTISWYLIAQENLTTAKVLLNNKRIYHCVFFLQQSIECIIKGILLENKFIDNVKDFNHKPEDAIEQFYIQLDSESIHVCNYIKKEMCSIVDFESRLIQMAKIANSYTIQYTNLIQHCPSEFMIDPSVLPAIGLDAPCKKEVIYNRLQKIHYTNTLIYCFAILFNNVQQNTRYPIKECEKIMPGEKYSNTPKTVNGLNSIIRCFEFIIRTILYE